MAYPNDPILAKYKVYDGYNWLVYHFVTSAGQVNTTNTRKFVTSDVKVNNVPFSLGLDNNASVVINGSHIVWYNGETQPSNHYLGNESSIQAALVKLDNQIAVVANSVPPECLTYGANGNFDDQFPDLNAIEALTGTTGLLKKTAANTWTLDQTAYLTASTGVTSVAGHNGAVTADQLKTDLGLGAAAYKGIANGITQNETGLTTGGLVYAFIASALSTIPTPMQFKGTVGASGSGATITSLPAASSSNKSHMYKVISAGTYQTITCKVGDALISDGSAWILIPSGDDIEDTHRAIKVNGTQLLASGISTGAVNFVNGGHITLTGSGNNITLGVESGYSIPTTAKQTAWDAKYAKPQGGIPAEDLAVAYLPLAGGTINSGAAVNFGNSSSYIKFLTGQQSADDELQIYSRDSMALKVDKDSALYMRFGANSLTMHYDSDDKYIELGAYNSSADHLPIILSGKVYYGSKAASNELAKKSDIRNVFLGTTTPTGMKTGDLWFDGVIQPSN